MTENKNNVSRIAAVITFLIFAFFIQKHSFGQFDTGKFDYKTITVEGGTVTEADESITDLVKENFAIISDKQIENIIDSRSVQKILYTDSTETSEIVSYNIEYKVPQNFLLDTVKILWELNIPEFRSHLFQLYKNDTVYIDTWPNVVGKASDKTYTGYFEAYRIRNWPTWKDPEKGKEHLPATPP